MEGAFKPLFGTGSRSSSIEDTNDAIRARLSLSGPLPNITELYEAEELTDYENLSSNDANNRVSFKDGGAQLNRDNSANYGSDLDDRAKALLQSYMTENYGDYLTASQPSSVPPDEIHQPPQPHYLSETFASRAPDYSAQAEAERLSNTFRTGSHWSIKNLPNYFEPGSIRGERKAHAMTNLLGKEYGIQLAFLHFALYQQHLVR